MVTIITLATYLIVLHAVAVNPDEDRCIKPALFRKEPLVYLKDGSIVKSLTKEIILGCEWACSKTSSCKSVNVRKREDGYYDRDLLSENTVTPGRVLEPLKDSTYYEVCVVSLKSSLK